MEHNIEYYTIDQLNSMTALELVYLLNSITLKLKEQIQTDMHKYSLSFIKLLMLAEDIIFRLRYKI